MRIDKVEILWMKLRQHGYESVEKISKALNMNHSSVSHALLYDNRSPMFMKKLSDLIGEDLMWLATGDVGKWN